MSNLCKRLLVLLTVVLMMFSLTIVGAAAEAVPEKTDACYDHGDVNGDGMITDQDAIYVLYSTFPMFKDTYPVSQNVDLNGDGTVNTADAIYLLYAAFHMTGYELDGTVHAYFEPVWNWTETEDGMSAEIAFRCGCGQEHAPLTAEVVCEEKAATCVEAGYRKYTATVEYDGHTYTTDKTVVLSSGSAGHVIGQPTCTEAAKCANCDFELAALGHKFTLKSTTAATCQTPAVETWECACGEQKTVTLEATLDHTYKYVENGDVLYSTLGLALEGAEKESCLWVKKFACVDCGAEKEVALEDTYHKHTYSVALTTEPTCVSAGVKTYTCSDCGDSYTEAAPVNPDAHNWNSGVTENGVTTYTCTHNAAHTKTAVAMTDAGLAADALSGTEVALEQGTTVALDAAAVEGLEADKNIVISVSPADVSGILTEEQKNQIGDNTVYDFSMNYDDGSAVSNFAGEVTVSLPYTLKEGDDIDSIDVWFLDAAGNPTRMAGTYANGFVTFTTTHFSYYTVTRLTPAERCARYGHITVDSEKAATCTEDGYSMSVCHRCGEVLEKTVYTAAGHSYNRTDLTVATCDQDGTYRDVCAVCNHTVNGTVPALGHALELDETRSTGTTCASAGKNTYVCTNEGCDYEMVDELAQLDHTYEITETQVDCTTNGSKVQTCTVCGASEILEATAALGHDYKAENAVWIWNEGYTAATVTLTCAHDASHTETLTAVITKTNEATSCVGGTITYTAKASLNKTVYTDVKTITVESVSHQPGEEWVSGSLQHYHECTVCQEKLDAADHVWDEGTVTKAATCVDSGTVVYTCQICGYEKTMTLGATGKHSYYYGWCTVCGHVQSSCTHVRLYRSEVDISAYNICGSPELEKVVCSCGEYGYVAMGIYCDLQSEFETRLDADGNEYEVNVATCADCGLTIEDYMRFVMLEDQCAGVYIYYNTVAVNGTTIISTQYRMDEAVGGINEHPCTVEKETQDLSAYGMCAGAELVTMACPCGEQEQTYVNDNCQWTTLNADYDNNFYSAVCTVCGTVREDTWTSEEMPGTCYVVETSECVYYRNDQQIAAFTNGGKWEDHDYTVKSSSLNGTTCDEGVYMILSCADCGKEKEHFVEYHYGANRAEIDVSGKGLCFDTLIQTTCLCGQKEQNYWEEGESYCDWQQTSADEESGITVWTCSVCGATRTSVRTVSDKDANCYIKTQATVTYKDASGTVVAMAYESSSGREHDFKTTAKLLGTDCKDGVVVSYVCKDCGFEGGSHTEYDHIGVETNRYTIEDTCFGDVVLYSCACGQNSWYEIEDQQNNWYEVDYEELENGYQYTEMCYGCCISKTEKRIKLYTIDQCRYTQQITVTFTRDSEQLLTFTYDRISSNHKSVYELTLLNGTSCEDGRVQVNQTCLTCGYTDTWTNGTGHRSYVLSREIVSEGQFCADLEKITQGCACGQEKYERIDFVDGWCENRTWYYDEETDEHVGKCLTCGLEERQKSSETPVEGTTCQTENKWVYRYVAEGVEIASCEEIHIYESHDQVSTFEMLGETCDDGYYVNWSCEKCGDSGRYGPVYGCEHHTIACKTYHDGTGICGPIVWNEHGCPCGYYHEGYLETYNCDWSWVDYDEKLGTTYRCTTCGLTRTGFENSERIPGTCQTDVTYYYVYSMNGEELFTVDRQFTRTEHQTVATYEMLGETCDDGYRIAWNCVDCDYTENWNEIRTGHENHRTAYYDLTDYGFCGGYVEIYSCPCGERADSNWNFECSWNSTGATDPDTGLRIRRCSKCGAEGYYGDVTERNTETCRREGTFYANFTRDGETLLDVASPVNWESHDYYAVEMSLMDPNGTCEDGFTVTLQCKDCGDSFTDTRYYHERFRTAYLDLAEAGACGGFFEQYACACGESKGVSWNYECNNMSYDSWSEMDDSYITHYYTERVCPDCGLTLLEEEWSVFEGDSCIGTYNEIWTVSMNDVELGTFTRKWETDRHSMEITNIELRSGSVTCDDGITVYRQCRDCGYTDSYNTSGHEYLCVDSIDLTAYGSVCGGDLNHYKCACGQYQRYDFDEELLCDLDRKYISHWIDGVIDTDQYTSLGHVGSWSDSYTFICAVTDPVQCGLKIRMSEYWLNEGCMAVEYQTWQLGYDDLAGTWQEEFTIATGSRHAYHPYTTEAISETYADGSYMEGTLYTCPDCGSTYTYKNTYASDGDHIKRERHAENALYATNGENQSYYYVYEYGLEYSGYRYRTLERWEYVSAEGDLRWEQYAWEYDFTNGCYGIRTYTNSNGHYDSYEFDGHNTTYETVDLEERTCTQFGTRQRTWTCQVCQEVTDVETWKVDPRAHSWSWDSDKQTYVCYYCELESINGASGAVVLEDFTEEYGNGTDYVIGYWNRDEVEFLCSVSVILDDVAEDQDNELYLTDIEFNYLRDPITAVSCSKAVVQTAADAALANAGYTGSYAIRISCVPVNAEDTLDYAITFDSQLAE